MFSPRSTRKIRDFEGHLQVGDGLLTRYGGEMVQEVVEDIAGLQMLDEDPHWHTSASENSAPFMTSGSRETISALFKLKRLP